MISKNKNTQSIEGNYINPEVTITDYKLIFVEKNICEWKKIVIKEMKKHTHTNKVYISDLGILNGLTLSNQNHCIFSVTVFP